MWVTHISSLSVSMNNRKILVFLPSPIDQEGYKYLITTLYFLMLIVSEIDFHYLLNRIEYDRDDSFPFNF